MSVFCYTTSQFVDRCGLVGPHCSRPVLPFTQRLHRQEHYLLRSADYHQFQPSPLTHTRTPGPPQEILADTVKYFSATVALKSLSVTGTGSGSSEAGDGKEDKKD